MNPAAFEPLHPSNPIMDQLTLGLLILKVLNRETVAVYALCPLRFSVMCQPGLYMTQPPYLFTLKEKEDGSRSDRHWHSSPGEDQRVNISGLADQMASVVTTQLSCHREWSQTILNQ